MQELIRLPHDTYRTPQPKYDYEMVSESIVKLCRLMEFVKSFKFEHAARIMDFVGSSQRG